MADWSNFRTRLPADGPTTPVAPPTGGHPKLVELCDELGRGRYGGGFLRWRPFEDTEVLAQWLGGENPSRVPLGTTALGHILYFRDLRDRARALGLDEETIAAAFDIGVVDVHYKRIDVLATTLEELAEALGNADLLDDDFMYGLYRDAVSRLGEPTDEEIFGFVPALALGGEPAADNLQRVDANVHWDLLFQL